MAGNKKELAPVKLELIICIVDKSKVLFYTDLLQTCGSSLQVATGAKGTADTSILDMDLLENRFRNIRNGKGIAIAVPLTSTIGTLVYGFLTGDERMISNG